jgi:hypothetical protein
MSLRFTSACFCIIAVALGAATPSFAQIAPSSTTIDPAASVPRPGQRPDLNPEQRSAIFEAVRRDKTKVARREFPAQVGAEVPPSLELYMLPDDAIAQAPITKHYRFVVLGERVVLVDPTNMRVVEVIDR